jgi:hypothetical protein
VEVGDCLCDVESNVILLEARRRSELASLKSLEGAVIRINDPDLGSAHFCVFGELIPEALYGIFRA